MHDRPEGDKSSNAVKAGMWYAVSSIALKAMSIITTPLYTRLLTKADYGIAQTFGTWFNLMMIICSLNLTWSISKAKQDFPGQLKRYIGSLQIFTLGFTLLVGVLVAAAWGVVGEWFGMSPLLMLLLFIYLLATDVVSLEQTKVRYEYKYKENIFITVFMSLSTIATSVLLILVLREEHKYLGRIVGCVIPPVVLAMVFLMRGIRDKRYAHIEKSYIQYGVSIAGPLIVHTISLNILAQSDRLVINSFCGEADVGLYSLAYQYAILVNIFLNAINEAWHPWFADQYHAGNLEGIRRNVKPIIGFGCLLGVGCAALAPEAILILGGEEYAGSVGIVPVILMGIMCEFLYTRYVHIELQLKKTGMISLATGIAAALNLALNILFIPRYGFEAAAYTTLISYLVLLALHYCITRFRLKVHLYADRRMFASFLVALALIVIMRLLYGRVLLRILLLVGVIGGYVYCYRIPWFAAVSSRLGERFRKTGREACHHPEKSGIE